ncbi:MAG: HD-GYP domain-containing protein [Chromatocurvus sp.]
MLDVIKMDTDSLEPGMYVSGLDRPWLGTPFLLQGFQITSNDEVRKLREYCQYVFIDIRKSQQQSPAVKRRRVEQRPRLSRQDMFPRRQLNQYRDEAGWTEEFPRAESAVAQLHEGIEDIFGQVRGNDAVDVIRVKRSVEPMIDSISRNPDACIWLARLKHQDKYTYQHSVAVSIWAVALGRQLGLPRSDLRSLAIGGLLFDIGKLRVAPELLNSIHPLSQEEIDKLREHVRHGVEMIGETGLMNTDVLDMVAHHHERHDGSGYPQGLAGDDIPIFGRIAGIVDCYDAITSQRSYADPMSPSAAIKILHNAKDADFQAELVEEFIQAVGIYPAGTLVELSSGHVAVVVAEYRTRRLRPRLMVLLDADKQAVNEVSMLDLLTDTQCDDGSPLEIVRSLEPGAHGIDMNSIQL